VKVCDLNKFFKRFLDRFNCFSIRIKILIFLFLLILFCLIVVPFFGLKLVCPSLSDVSSPSYHIMDGSQINLNISEYNRPEESTYLTFPEWHLVYIPEEYADWIKSNPPSSYPYFASISQFWEGYCNVYEITKGNYGFNIGDHFMLWVIGTSSSIEFGAKGIYENSVGRFSEWTSSNDATEEDEFAYHFNKEYVNFLYDYPWYEFSFASQFGVLWKETDIFGEHIIRKFERRIMLSFELIIKTIYGGLINGATFILYGKAPLEIYATVENSSEYMFRDFPKMIKVQDLEGGLTVVKLPRYGEFTEILPRLSNEGLIFVDIAGNDEIFLTAVVNKNWDYELEEGEVLFNMNILTNKDDKRIGIRSPVKSLSNILNYLESKNAKIEHLYDY